MREYFKSALCFGLHEVNEYVYVPGSEAPDVCSSSVIAVDRKYTRERMQQARVRLRALQY